MPIDTIQEIDMVEETHVPQNNKPSVRSNYLSKQIEESLDWVKQFWNEYLGMLDQLWATPLANFNAGDAILSVPKNSKRSKSATPFYDDVNNSPYAIVWDGLLVAAGFFTLLIAHVVSIYRVLRKGEKKSHFFYFRRLLQSEQSATVKKVMDDGSESKIPYDILSAAAYFYSPGIYKLVCRKRRFFCLGKRRKEYARLKEYLAHKGLTDKRTEKEILNDIFIEIIDKLVKYLNEETTSSDSILPEKFQREGGTYSIGFSEKYSKLSFSRGVALPEKPKKNVSLGQSILGAIGEASFLYWLGMFVFYFVQVGMIAGISFPPLALAFFFLTIRCIYIAYSFKKDAVNQQIRSLNNEKTDALEVAVLKKRDESDYVELKKQEVFVKAMVARVELTPFKDSKLHKDLQKLLGKRRFMWCAAVLDAFVVGCFLPFFGIWLFNDLFKVVAGLAIGGTVIGPVVPAAFGILFMIIAGATLLLGVSHGIKKAIEAGKVQDEEYKKLEKAIEDLEKSPENQMEVLNLSLYKYDRLFRRYSLEQPVWTTIKKGLNRAGVVISRLGTGSLVFRLVILGSITSFVAIPAAACVPPILMSLVVGFAMFFAVWYFFRYEAEKKWQQAENITNHLGLSKVTAEAEKEIDRPRVLDQESLLTRSLATISREPRLSSSGGESPSSNRIITAGGVNFKGVDPREKEEAVAGNSYFRQTSFRSVSEPQLWHVNYPLERTQSEGALKRFGLQGSKNSLKSSQDLSSNGTAARHRVSSH